MLSHILLDPFGEASVRHSLAAIVALVMPVQKGTDKFSGDFDMTSRVRCSPGVAPRAAAATNRLRPQRNAASVLPEPVGALISTFSPVAIAGQASTCAGVGASKALANQSRTSGVKAVSGTNSDVSARGGRAA